MDKKNTIRILGLDPGFARVGFAVLDKTGSHLKTVVYGCLETKKGTDFCQRLVFIAQELKKIIKKHRPDVAAAEEIFFFKNQKTAMAVAQARGVLILAAAEAGLPVLELTPLQVKQSLVGYGRADKAQVQKMAQLVLKLKEKPRPDDAADALAVAVTAAHNLKHSFKTTR